MNLAEAHWQLLATLLLKVGIIASIASVLIRSSRFKELVFRDSRTPRECLELGAEIGVPVAIGVMLRVQFHIALPDLGLEAALLAGVLGGHLAGVTAGLLAALPTLFGSAGPEWLTPPVMALAGLVGGAARRIAPQTEGIWHFSPFVDMNIYRWYQRRFGKPRGDWQLLFFLMIAAVEANQMVLARFSPGLLYSLHNSSKLLLVAIAVAGIIAIATAIKIWSNTRNELKIEEQKRLLEEARMVALTSQINPHFLFNTLNSVTSLIRTDPELARLVVFKLSNILRRLLRRYEAFTTLQDELAFLDDYLSIEKVRFGEKLKIVKKVEESAMDAMIPSMLLQPLIENSIKHGISSKVEGGTIQIRSSRSDSRVRIEVLDNGVGIAAARMESLYEDGIGLNNIRERIKVLYGSDFTFEVQSQPGEGTRVSIDLPHLQPKEE